MEGYPVFDKAPEALYCIEQFDAGEWLPIPSEDDKREVSHIFTTEAEAHQRIAGMHHVFEQYKEDPDEKDREYRVVKWEREEMP